MSSMTKYGSLKRNNSLRIIKMKIKYLCALLLAALIYSCDDSTTGIRTDLIPGGDKIPANTDSYEFTTKSLLVDSVYVTYQYCIFGTIYRWAIWRIYCRLYSTVHLYGQLQIWRRADQSHRSKYKSAIRVFFGDSLNAMRLQVDTLDKVIPEKN